MYFLLNMVIFQPGMLVYHRVSALKVDIPNVPLRTIFSDSTTHKFEKKTLGICRIILLVSIFCMTKWFNTKRFLSKLYIQYIYIYHLKVLKDTPVRSDIIN